MTADNDKLFNEARAILSELYFANFDVLSNYLRGRGMQLADAEEIVASTFARMLDKLAAARDAENSAELARFLENVPGPGYLRIAVKNESISEVRKPGPTPLAEPDIGGAVPFEENATGVMMNARPHSVADTIEERIAPVRSTHYSVDPAEVVISSLAAAKRRAALRSLVRVLIERGVRKRERRATSGISSDDVELLDRYYMFGGNDDVAGTGPIPDASTMRREREARERSGHVFDPNRGRGTEVARRLGKDKATVSRRVTALLRILGRAVYVAGVLAPPGTIHKPSQIHRAFDGYDRFVREKSTTTIELLETAAEAVRTTDDRGTRVDVDRFRTASARRRRKSGDRTEPLDRETVLSALHDGETEFATFIENPHPNCVTSCELHNPDPARTWEL